ncbi:MULTISPECIES: ADOP family duplicated permease [unclassified Pseudomonas]|uniref:ADOP family duplicated permease n=1 Tax=unclassified Pseudomonas TaxID=196821 RepID=UPI0011AA8573|nr:MULTISPECIES: ADOP family duplicated permease [unclassified Pseudomonas]TWC22881.1 putative permease [Pseudomonas sp. SJZ075]TWC38239.1 putative permease [Pseudomonas sp. SJZ078]TWC58829.1 putative permease [Pseudomonas sp. SJZ124]TWC94306.1 putative permease [Pseudomonas sp. SJZ101]
MLFDIRYALRLLLKSPGFTFVTVLIMSCGLALTLYMFSVINTIMFTALPYPDGKSMVLINPTVNGVSLSDSGLNFMDYGDLKARSTQFEDMGYFYAERADISDGSKAVSYMAIRNTAELFSYTAVQPFRGRLLNQEDVQAGAEPVAVISYAMWQNYFASDEQLIGRDIRINGIHTRIVGIMPQNFAFPFFHDLWLPSQLVPSQYLERKGAPEVSVYARLKPGVSLGDANRDLNRVMQALASEYPESNKGLSAQALTFQENFMGEETTPIFIVMLFAVCFVLLLACCNVGNLLLARTTERAKEIAIRVALGSPAGRLVLQMMLESLFICLLSGVVAVLLAAWGLEITNSILPGFVPNKIPFWWQLSLDNVLVLNALVLVVITAVLTSALPAWKIVRGNFNEVLRDGTRGAQSRGAGRVSRILVIVEVGLSCSILCISALFALLVYQATRADYGVDPRDYLTAQIHLNANSYPDDASRILFYQRLQDAVAAIPSVENAALTTSAVGQFTVPRQVEVDASTNNRNERWSYPMVNDVQVMPGSLSAMGITPKAGREFVHGDTQDSQQVVVVSQSFAEQFWPGERDVIGKRLRFRDTDDQRWYTVVGVAPSVIHGRPFSAFRHRTTVYRSLEQQSAPSLMLVLRSQHAETIGPALVNAVRQVDSDLSVNQIQTLGERLARNTAGLHFIANLFMLFGLVAMILAATGIYAVMCNLINQRTQEIGLRMAMGATEGNLLRMLMVQGGKQLLTGLIIGLPLAFFVAPKLTRVLGNGNTPFVLLFWMVALMITLVVALAVWVPSRRATNMSPADAIRYE